MKFKLLPVLFVAIASITLGCGSGEPPKNEAGAQATSGKAYSAAEADAAQPKRGSSDAR